MKKIILLICLFLLMGCTNKETKEIVKEKKIVDKKITLEDYQKNSVNELGEVPIMMYHGIVDMKNDDTKYIGGNVDKDGYQRTSEAFRNDLDFYYNNGYRMIRLTDYIDGNINVELGKSPIILTFDDGLANNIKVTGLDNKGDIIIDPNSAVGILEEYKNKYKDFNITATFFINGLLFNQDKYNDMIITWLINHGYDIGNHSYNHVDFSKVDVNKAQEEIGKLYEKISNYKFVNIVALPYGSPYKLNHANMNYIFNTNYNGKKYITKSTLRVGWKSEYSPYIKDFNPKFLKRIRAYDNNGKEFDIKMNFELLEKIRYISDGDESTIAIPKSSKNLIGNIYNKKVIEY